MNSENIKDAIKTIEQIIANCDPDDREEIQTLKETIAILEEKHRAKLWEEYEDGSMYPDYLNPYDECSLWRG